MYKNKYLILLLSILVLNFVQVKSQKSYLSNLDKSKYEVFNLIINRISSQTQSKFILISDIIGGNSFSNNLSCRNEILISKFVNDSLHLNTIPTIFKHSNKIEILNPKYLDTKFNYKIIRNVDPVYKRIIRISNPNFFNKNQNCFISYEIGEYEFENLILSKENKKWIVKYVFCGSSNNY